MPWNGSGVAQVTDGTFTGTAIWTQEKNAANLVTAAHFDTYSADICGMLQNCLTIDAQTTGTLIKLVPTTSSIVGVINIGGVNFANMSGTQNVYVGGAGNFSIFPSNNVGIGFGAMNNTTNSGSNVVVGALSAINLTSSSANVIVGYSSGPLITGGSGLNVAIGFLSVQNLTTGNSNVLIGSNVAINLSTGNNNVAIGSGTGSVTTGSQNIEIGSAVGVPTLTASGQINIGCAIFGTGNTGIGSAPGTGKIGINNNAPAYTLDVAGDLGVTTAGKGLRVKEGSNAKQGTTTLVAGTVTVANTSVTANSRIVLQGLGLNASTAVGELRVTTITPGTSFVIRSLIPGGVTTQTGDLSTIFYEIFEPA